MIKCYSICTARVIVKIDGVHQSTRLLTFINSVNFPSVFQLYFLLVFSGFFCQGGSDLIEKFLSLKGSTHHRISFMSGCCTFDMILFPFLLSDFESY